MPVKKTASFKGLRYMLYKQIYSMLTLVSNMQYAKGMTYFAWYSAQISLPSQLSAHFFYQLRVWCA
jgi:hypothetical protein